MRNPEKFEPELERQPEPESETGRKGEKESESSPTEKRFKEIEQEVDKMADAKGWPIEPGIKDMVVALKAWEFPTSASCEGHTDRPVPWVDIEAPNEPREKHKGDIKLSEEIAKKYDVSPEDVRKENHFEAYKEWEKEMANEEETSEYKKWDLQNKELAERIERILDEFYKEKETTTENTKLNISDWSGGFRICNRGKDYGRVLKDISEQEREALGKRLKARQKEMQEFAEFLKKNYSDYAFGRLKV